MVLEVDGQTDGQPEVKAGGSTNGRVILILRPSCKEEAKDIYTVFQFFGFDKFSEWIFGLAITPTKCKFFYLI